MHAGEQAAVDDVIRVAVDDALLVFLRRARLCGGDKSRADVGEVSAHGLRGQHCAAGGNRAAQSQGAIKPLADLLHQGKRAFHARMATSASGHGDKAICALLDHTNI